MSAIAQALGLGYTSQQILRYLSQHNPDLAAKISTAIDAGHSIDHILRYIQKNEKKLGKASPQKESPSQSPNLYKAAQQSIHPSLKGIGQVGAVAAGAAGAYALARAAPQLAQTAMQSGFPGSPLTPPGQTPTPPQTPSPQGAAPIQPVPEGSPQVSTPTPPPAPVVEVKPILDKFNLTAHVDKAAKNVKDPKAIAAILYNSFPNEMKQFQKEAGKPMEDAIADYLQEMSNVPRGTEPIGEKVLGIDRSQEVEERLKPLREKVSSSEELTKKKETLKPKTGEPYDLEFVRNTKSSPNLGARFGQDIEPHGRYMREGKAEYVKDMPNMETGKITFNNPLVLDFGGGYQEKDNWKKVLSKKYDGKTGKELSQAIINDGHDAIITLETDKRGNTYTSEIVDLTSFEPSKKTKKIKKSEIVMTPSGVGEVKAVRNGKAIVDVDGRKHQVNEDELIESPLPEKDLADLYDDVLRGVEKETGQQVSRNVELAGYNPDDNELLYKPFGSDQMWVYDDISQEDADLLTSLLVQRKTTGKNFIGGWEKGTTSPIGAAMSALIQKLQKERGGKGNEYKSKFQTLYDALEPAKLALKDKKQAAKKEERRLAKEKKDAERKKKAKKPRAS